MTIIIWQRNSDGVTTISTDSYLQRTLGSPGAPRVDDIGEFRRRGDVVQGEA